MATITVLNRQQSFTARDGSSILKAALDNKAVWRWFCGGQALCGTCCMLVVSGKVSDPTESERYFIEGWGYHPNFRLACQTRALGDVAVVSCMEEDYDPDAVLAAYDKAAATQAK
jgi:ferredoxin, 2Fe-2S